MKLIQSIQSSHLRSLKTCAIIPCLALFLSAMLMPGCASTKYARFSTPQQAADAFIAAFEPPRNNEELERIFGPDVHELLSSGDPVQDRLDSEDFVSAYRTKHGFETNQYGETVLTVGDDDFPFAIPLVKDNGDWYFDTVAGHDEVLNRRVGRNELDTIQTCLAVLDAQFEYAQLDIDADGLPEYARQFRSDPGKHNGLYWPTDANSPPCPLGWLVAEAEAKGYERRADAEEGSGIYCGYRFRILHAQGPDAAGGQRDYIIHDKMIGGFALVAWPVTYGNSGIMTFIVNHDGFIFQKDLGENTDRHARAMKAFNPDRSWSRVNARAFVD